MDKNKLILCIPILSFNSAEYEIRLTKTWKNWTISAKFERIGKLEKLNSSLARDLGLNLLSVLFLKEQPEGSWAGVEGLLKKEKKLCNLWCIYCIENRMKESLKTTIF